MPNAASFATRASSPPSGSYSAHSAFGIFAESSSRNRRKVGDVKCSVRNAMPLPSLAPFTIASSAAVKPFSSTTFPSSRKCRERSGSYMSSSEAWLWMSVLPAHAG